MPTTVHAYTYVILCTAARCFDQLTTGREPVVALCKIEIEAKAHHDPADLLLPMYKVDT